MAEVKKKSMFLKILLIVIIIILLLFLGLTLLIHFSVTGSFTRGGYPDYPTTDYRYSHYEKDYPRIEKTFMSGKNKLNAYLYGDINADRLLVFSHGLGGAHEDYMKELIEMADRGYLVFAYDATGSGTSEGKSTKGLLQSALDLEAALNYINSDQDLNSKSKYLMGHSWGGFAVAEALGYRDDITAVASIAGYAYPVELLAEQGSEMMGTDLTDGRADFFFYISQLLSFGGKNYKRNAVDSINASDTPILLIHGTADEMISFDHAALIAHLDELINPNVKTYIICKDGQNGHNNLFHPTEALSYIAEKNQEFNNLETQYQEEMPLEVRQKFVDSVDLDRVNQVNKELLDRISDFFDQASR